MFPPGGLNQPRGRYSRMDARLRNAECCFSRPNEAVSEDKKRLEKPACPIFFEFEGYQRERIGYCVTSGSGVKIVKAETMSSGRGSKKSVVNFKVRIFFAGQTKRTFFIRKRRDRFYFSNGYISFTNYHRFSLADFCQET